MVFIFLRGKGMFKSSGYMCARERRNDCQGKRVYTFSGVFTLTIMPCVKRGKTARGNEELAMGSPCGPGENKDGHVASAEFDCRFFNCRFFFTWRAGQLGPSYRLP